MARSKNVARSMALFKNEDCKVFVVERWIPGVHGHGIRKDLGGFQDLQVWDQFLGIIAVQVCAHSELNAHHEKLFTPEVLPNIKHWLRVPGCSFEMHGWRKLKKKLKNGKYGKGYHWVPEIIDYKISDFE